MTELSVFRSRAVVTPDGKAARAVHTRDGVITAVSHFDDVPAGAELHDLGNFALLPGLVDTHVHINEPGRTEWEGFHSATRAAAAGGVTTLVEMPLNALPPTTSLAGLEAKRAAADGGAAGGRSQLHVDLGFWGGVVPGNTDQLEPLWRAGLHGFKAFMCPSGVPEFQASSTEDLLSAARVLAPLGAPLLVHAESPEALAAHAAAGEISPEVARRYATFLATRPALAEDQAIETLLGIAAATGLHVHLVHLASSGSLEQLADARRRGDAVTVETCPHYLFFDAARIPDGRTEFKCAPPIRDRANREALWDGLRRGIIDLIATDHSPCPPSLKRPDTGSFLDAWGGIASLQLGVSVVWTEARLRGFLLTDLARWMSGAPARLAGLTDRGAIAVGRNADFTVFDPDAEWTVEPAGLQHRHRVTPYAGERLTGLVRSTFLRGVRIFQDGEFPGAPRGRLLVRPR